MKLKLFTHISCEFGNFRAGDVCDLPDHIAKGLLDGKYAEVIEDVAAPAEVQTTEAPAAEERADAPEASPRKRRRAK